MDYYLNPKLKTLDDFKEYIQSEQVKKEYKKIESETNLDENDQLSDTYLLEIINLVKIKDYCGAERLIDKRLHQNTENVTLRVLKIISSFKGKNPVTFSCSETKAILDSLSCVAMNMQNGALAMTVHSAIALAFEQFHGTKFKCLDMKANDFSNIDETAMSILSLLNIPKFAVNKSINLSEGYNL